MDNMTEAAKTVSQNNKLLRKQRVMRYFIDAAKELANESGIESITIRSVAERAGYNSASLYNYFESLDQLLAFTSIDLMYDWLSDLAKIEEADFDVMTRYIMGWENFAKHSAANPEGYAYAYVTAPEDEIPKYFESYREAFPDAFSDIPENLVNMFKQKSLRGQEDIMIAPVIKEGYIRAEDAPDIYNLAHILHSGLLMLKRRKGSLFSQDDYVATFMKYFISFIRTKLRKSVDLSRFL